MKPKEKATEIINEIYCELLQVDSDVSEEILISILSKKLALISVNNILGVITITEIYDYWLNVKTEIELLNN